MLKNNKIFKTSDLQKLDKYTIENEPVTSLDLMERAATVFTEKLLIFFPNNHIFNILAGFGNNGVYYTAEINKIKSYKFYY